MAVDIEALPGNVKASEVLTVAGYDRVCVYKANDVPPEILQIDAVASATSRQMRSWPLR